MASEAGAWRINSPRVAHQTMDSETIIIDFDTGSYFSTNVTGAAVWQQVAENASLDRIVQVLTQEFGGDADAIRDGVEQFLDELQREALITLLDPALFSPNTSQSLARPNPATKLAFEMPVLNKYTDMQDLLLLDAIHDVDEQGWPYKKDENAV